jgi:hypothetical protein
VTSNQQRSYVRSQSSPEKPNTSREIDVARSSASQKQGSEAAWQTGSAADESTSVGSAVVKVLKGKLKQMEEKQMARRASAAGLQVP